MLEFDPDDPYPLLPEGAFTYADEKAHAARVDAWIGLDTERVEDGLVARLESESGTQRQAREQQPWIGLGAASLLTPYTELREILEALAPKPGDTVVDLGAAYGRMGFVMGRHFPASQFVGFELRQERVSAAKDLLARHNPLAEIHAADLLHENFKLTSARFYFMYDFGTRAAIEKVLRDLMSVSKDRAITVVGRGRASRDAIERQHPWLSQVVMPEHRSRYSIYRSRID